MNAPGRSRLLLRRRILAASVVIFIIGGAVWWFGIRETKHERCKRLVRETNTAAYKMMEGILVQPGDQTDAEQAAMEEALDDYETTGCDGVLVECEEAPQPEYCYSPLPSPS